MSDLKTTLDIALQSDVEAGLKRIIATFKQMSVEFQKFAKIAEKGVTLDPVIKKFLEMSNTVRGVGTNISETSKQAKAFSNTAKTAAEEAKSAFSALDAEIRKVKDDLAKGGAVGSFSPGSYNSRAMRESITGESKARATTRANDAMDFGAWRTRQRIKSNTLRAEEKATRTSERLSAKADAERSRSLRRSASGALSHGHSAIRSLEHPWLQSPAFVATIGAGIAAAATRSLLSEAAKIDTATTRYKMLAVPDGQNANAVSGKVRSQALRDSIGLGVDADVLIDVQTKAIRDGIAPAIAKTLPKVIVSAANLMSDGSDGSVEAITDRLSEMVQQMTQMDWIKDAAGARSAINIEAGISNFAGNSGEKMEQFTAGGGWGHGKELGWNLKQTAEAAALLNSSGERTGMASSRALGQLSQSVPEMADKYRKAQRSHGNSDEDRAVRNAPNRLGYGSIKSMQQSILSGPEGLADFAERLQKVDEKNRKLILKGYGFSEQLGAPLAEISRSKLASIKTRTEELAAETADNDYLGKRFTEFQNSLVAMLKQIEGGWKAIEAELGDTVKDDIVEPFRNWWIEVSTAILNSGLKVKFHQAIMGFVHGLGFEDVSRLLKSLTGQLKGFDIVGFATGIGEGIRTVATSIKSLFDVISFGSGDAHTMGRLTAELLGFSLMAVGLGPIIGILSSVTSGLKAMFNVIKLMGGLTALALGGEGAGAGIAGGIGAAAIGVLPVAIAAVTLGAIAVTIMNWDGIKSSFSDAWDHIMGRGKSAGSSDHSVAGQDYNDLGLPGIEKEAYHGGDFKSLLHQTSWESDGSDEEIKDAILSTAKSTDAIQESLRRSAALAMLATIEAGMDAHGGDANSGSSSTAGAPNMRYGRKSGGGYGGTPGGGGQKMSGGSGGSRSWRNSNPGNIEYGAYAKSMGATGTDGRFAVFPDYAAGRHAQEHLLFESKGYRDLTLGQAIGKWAPGSENNVPAYIGAMGGDSNAKMSSFNSTQRSALLDAMQKHEGWKVGTKQNTSVSSTTGFQGGSGNTSGAVDKAMSMLGMGEGASGKALGAYMHSGEWCADFVNATLKSAGVKGSGSAMAASFSQWGNHVDMTNAQKGDVIEENSGGNSHVHHVGLATGNVQRDKNGNVTAVEMVSGNYGNAVRKNWEKVGIIADLRRSDDAIAATANAITKQSRGPAALAVPPASRLPEPQHSGGGSSMIQASGDTHFHIHGVTNPQEVANAVDKHWKKQRSSVGIDYDHAA